ncbi:dTMP kinase ['Fragaria x ananassa' phyllody phytoplasma]|uniref:Thymidylate kinase n=1 Tax='Fragaria x ananassa' phyllody phytoplasma TaxID=2358428 RepID=A0ABS5K5C4_9MOLU|nr:dTMP kinase ['Fragaria x ananassa' phyllody phytoplasma]MBS2126330.1 dTMP kinase ['Fragaria x ananassa' phyllody phytoplasma]
MFISFEGGEASGKTTLARMLTQKLTQQEYQVVLTKEPGGYSPFSFIREILLNPKMPKVSYETEALLYAADRIEHLSHVIIPAFEKKNIVICDRYLDSSFVYQGYARKLSYRYIAQINRFALKYLPHLTFYLDLEPVIVKKRLACFRELNLQNRLDLESLLFHQKIRQGYLKRALEEPKRIITVDASDSLEKVFAVIYQKVKHLLCNYKFC